MSFTRRRIRAIPLLIWLLLLSSGAYAFAQLSGVSVTPQASPAAVVTGYTVSNIAYTIRDTHPSSIAGVRFVVTPSSASARIATVRAKLVSSSASYSDCANTPAGSQGWFCPISGVTVASADQLMLDVGERPAGPGRLLLLPVIRR